MLGLIIILYQAYLTWQTSFSTSSISSFEAGHNYSFPYCEFDPSKLVQSLGIKN